MAPVPLTGNSLPAPPDRALVPSSTPWSFPTVPPSAAFQPLLSPQHLQRQTAFQALRPVTTQLLALRNHPDQLQPQLVDLRRLLETLPPAGVAGCWDYAAFPLLILVDAVVPARRQQQHQQAGGRPGAAEAGAAAAPAAATEGEIVAAACRSDRAVEALLGALQALLHRTPDRVPGAADDTSGASRSQSGPGASAAAPNGGGPSPAVERRLSVLQRLAPLLQLPRESASEEVHVAVQTCLAAALTTTGPPGGTPKGPAEVVEVEAEIGAARRGVGAEGGRGGTGGEARGGGLLCGEGAASLAGYLVHCCLEVAEREVLAGPRGSKKLCEAALCSLRLSVAALGDPDTLAFFLPGIVSGLAKQLYAAAELTGPSAPPGAAATVQALNCLRDVTVAVLSDDSTSALLGPTGFVVGSSHSAPSGAGPVLPDPLLPAASSADDALAALQALGRQRTADPDSASTTTSPPAPNTSSAAAGVPAGAPQARTDGGATGRRRLHVDRTPAWLEECSSRMGSLLARALPPLCAHPRPAVRAQLAATCAVLLDRCGASLAPSQPLLLRLLFTLAQDEWQPVAEPCWGWLARHTPAVPTADVRVSEQGALVGGERSGTAVSLVSAADSATAPVGGGVFGDLGRSGTAAASGSEQARSGVEGVAEGEAVDTAAVVGGGSGQQPAELRALQDEFERFMSELMSESALLDPPTLDLDEGEMYGGLDDAAGGRDQDGPMGAVTVSESAIAPVTLVDGVNDDVRQDAATAALPSPATEEHRTEVSTASEHVSASTTTGQQAAFGVRAGPATAAAASGSEAPPPAPPPPPPPPPPPSLPGLQRLLEDTASSAHLLRAVRAGEAEARLQARCLTTALLMAGPGRAAEWLLLRPAALMDLLGGLFRCFAFDRNAAPLILHLRGEPGAYAPPGASARHQSPPAGHAKEEDGPALGGHFAAGRGATGADAAAASGGREPAVELPRMPVGLLHLASQRSYAAVAAVARTLGWLARAADKRATGGGLSHGGGGEGRVLRRLLDDVTSSLRRASRPGATGLGLEGDGDYDEEQLREGPGGGPGGAATGPSWQCEVAAVVAVTAEVVFGASNAWTSPLEPSSASKPYGQVAVGTEHTVQGTADATQSVASPGLSFFPGDDTEYESILLNLLQELTRPAIIKLPTHNAAADSGGGRSRGVASDSTTALSYDDIVHPELATLRAPLSAQELGENVMLLRGVLEAVGTLARAVGPRFTSPGRMLRVVLVPLLELLGDPAPSVAASANTALQSICVHCGYDGSLKALVAANADFVVDALCARLRDLQRHPRAPHLLAALLRRAGVAPRLLPLMAEPLQRALQGLSVLARHWAPHYAHSYLAALRELAAGAAAEAEDAADHSRRAVDDLNRVAAEARDRKAVEEAQRSQPTATATATAASSQPSSASNRPDATTQHTHEDVRRYFSARARTRPPGTGVPGAVAGEGEEEGQGDGGERPLLVLAVGQLDEGELRFRRLHAAAVVAGAAADAATPLLIYRDLRAAVAAAEVLRTALAALAAATPAVEAEAAVLEAYGGPEARMRPVRPETPKVLPAVAEAWGPLMAALRDARTPAVERAVATVAELVVVAGGTFLSRRFQQEAWPVLQRLLTHGTAHTLGQLSLGTDAARSAPPRRRALLGQPGGGSGDTAAVTVSGGEDAAGSLAPAAVTRIRVAVLGCLAAVCRCRNAAAAVRTLTWSLAQAALPYLGAGQPPPLQEAAQAVLLAVADLDPDSVWLMLHDTSYNMPPTLARSAPGTGTTRAPPTGAKGESSSAPSGAPQLLPPQSNVPPVAVDCATVCPGPEFPPLRTLLPPLPGSTTSGRYGAAPSAAGLVNSSGQSQWAVTPGVARDCGPRAQALLGRVAACLAPWHLTEVPSLDSVW